MVTTIPQSVSAARSIERVEENAVASNICMPRICQQLYYQCRAGTALTLTSSRLLVSRTQLNQSIKFEALTVIGGQLAHLTKLRSFIRQQDKQIMTNKRMLRSIIRKLSKICHCANNPKATNCNKQEPNSACKWTPDVTIVVNAMCRHESRNISVCTLQSTLQSPS